MRYIESGPADGVPIVLIHGNLSTGRFFEHLMPGAPARYRLIAPDMRGFGDTEQVPIDATRGLRDWADDTYSLVDAVGIAGPVHLVGWSTGGAAIVDYAREHPVASLTFIDPVSPWIRRRASRRHAVLSRLRGLGRRYGQPRLHEAHRGPRHVERLAAVAAQRDEHLVLGSLLSLSEGA
jgi:pimeloyl-ACP methyl ester carboxylesterase